MKWYHEWQQNARKWQQNARNRYLEGYYPGHNRVPNPIVLSLYGIGYFFGDFVPLILNLINGIYWAIKRLVAFVVGLLVEASIFIVLAGSVVFSVAHSIERMRKVGATHGLEYVGVLMFEVIFVGSAATLTGFLMKKKIPRGFIEWLGLIFTLLGFLVGLAFVWWSNIQGMAPTLEGRIIGSAVPALVLIGEGILAYRFIIENKEDVTLQEFIRRNQLSTDEVKAVIEQYVQKKREEALPAEANGSEAQEKVVTEMVDNAVENGTESGNEMVEIPVKENAEKVVETTEENAAESTAEIVNQQPENQPQQTTIDQPIELVDNQPETTTLESVESTESANNQPVETKPVELVKKAVDQFEKPTKKMVEQPTTEVVEANHQNNHNPEQFTNQNTDQITTTKTNETNHEIDQPTNHISEEPATKISDQDNQPINQEPTNEPTKKTTTRKKRLVRKRTNSSSDKMKKAARKWALDYYKENGELPGRMKIEKNAKVGQSVARNVIKELEEELGIKKESKAS